MNRVIGHWTMSEHVRRAWSRMMLLSLLLVTVWAADAHGQVVDWVPDIIVRASDLYNNDVVTNIVPGRTHLRFSTSTANIGLGRLHLIGILPPLEDGSQLVMQRVFRSDGTYWDDSAGAFLYHPTHSHTHFNNWCIYRLRYVLANDGVGGVAAEGSKTSFCILDLGVYNSSLPNYNSSPYYTSCGSQVQGLSVGWFDLYSKSLPGQNIDITDLPDGEYWLEAEADPDNNVLEADDNNNITRIKVTIGEGSTILADAFEPNDTIPQVLGHLEGAFNSPNIGPANPRTVISDLSIHVGGNRDYFRFYCAGPGTSADSIRIDFDDSVGDLDLRLRDSAGNSLAVSEGVTNVELILLTGRPAGWYYVHVYGYQNATSPSYTLTIKPPTNGAPTISVIDPPGGITQRAHGFENYTTTWMASDSNGDPTWVTVWANTTPSFDGNELLVEGSIHTPGEDAYHIINSAALPPGMYWIYCQITDGGQISGDWSDGQIEFLTSFDSDFDGIYDYADNCIGWSNPGQEPVCTHHADPQADGVIDIFDVIQTIDVAFRGGVAVVDSDCPHDPVGRTDLNCDGATNIVDVSLLIEAAFRGAPAAFCNPCDCTSYPANCPQ